MASKRTIEAGIRTLDNMAVVVKAEQLLHGDYVTPGVVNETLAEQGAICGGHAACLLGTAAIGSPVRVSVKKMGEYFAWESYVEGSPSLRLAAETLDECAIKRATKLATRRSKRADRARRLLQAVEDGDYAPYTNGNTIMTGRIAESFFENVLGSIPTRRTQIGRYTELFRFARRDTRDEVLALIKDAKRQLRKQLR